MARSVRETVEHGSRLAADGIRNGFLSMCGPAILLLLVLASHAAADSFGSGDNSFNIDFVTIGDPGKNASTFGTPRAAGTVEYDYRIGKYEISRDMVEKANAAGNLPVFFNRLHDNPVEFALKCPPKFRRMR